VLVRHHFYNRVLFFGCIISASASGQSEKQPIPNLFLGLFTGRWVNQRILWKILSHLAWDKSRQGLLQINKRCFPIKKVCDEELLVLAMRFGRLCHRLEDKWLCSTIIDENFPNQ